MSEQEKTSEGCFCYGAGPRVSDAFRTCWSQATKDHFHNSRMEFWKGLRSLIDEKIERMSRGAKPKGTTVPVD
jgi:hypothetical protein